MLPSNLTELNKPEYWDNKYLSGETGWDMRTPNPVLTDALKMEQFIKPGKILIIGAGKGYDAVETARLGFETWALDFSEEALNIARETAGQNNVNVNFIQQDFFNIADEYVNNFDIVYEYVTYCAIEPGRRKEFPAAMSRLLNPKGIFITDLFPIDRREGGPPFSIDVNEFYKDMSEYFILEFSSKNINSIKPRKNKEILQIYRKKYGDQFRIKN